MQIHIIVFFPLLSFLFCASISYFNNKKFSKAVDISSISLVALAFLFSIFTFLSNENYDIKVFEFISFRDEVHTVKNPKLIGAWLVRGLKFNIGFFVDNLTKLMFIVVSCVSLVVHIYSTQYMKDDENKQRFMSYLSLFTFCMLVLVSAPNFVQLFLGWEGVGVCSYLLIGFWYKKDSAVNAANKAFIVNRVSDFAILIGILIILKENSSVNFSDIKSIPQIPAMLLFIGCMGKSAQLFFHVWLPDAMEGPTPVSALIHAATMVTAGVFLLARCNIEPNIIISIVGAATAIFGATVAITQDDIKKIIAYSTCSQLGYMFMASGSGAHQNAMFHLANHAFFKAMLFLCAGNIIHAVHEQNIFKISKISGSIEGGLASKMKITYLFFIVGSLAIVGIPPLSGYYSKDAVLESVRSIPDFGDTLYFIGVFVAFLTSIYSVKILYFVFYKSKNHKNQGKPEDKLNHIKEYKIKSAVLSILFFGSIFSGIYGFYSLNITQPSYYLKSANNFNYAPYHDHLPMIVGIFGLLCGYIIYKYKVNRFLAEKFSIVYNLLFNKYYFDELYDLTLVFAVKQISKIYYFVDKTIDNIFINGLSDKIYVLGKVLRKVNTGNINNYLSFSLVFITLVSFYISYIIIF